MGVRLALGCGVRRDELLEAGLAWDMAIMSCRWATNHENVFDARPRHAHFSSFTGQVDVS